MEKKLGRGARVIVLDGNYKGKFGVVKGVRLSDYDEDFMNVLPLPTRIRRGRNV